MKIYITGCAGIPARYGGFETFAENIAPFLAEESDVFVACSRQLYTVNERVKIWGNINRYFVPFKPNGFQSIFYDFFSLWVAFRKADFIIMLGSGSGWAIAYMKLFKKKPLAVHIDGLEWKRTKWNLAVKIFLRFNTFLCIKFADFIIVDNEGLYPYIPVKYTSKIVNIGYGCDHLTALQDSLPLHKNPFALVIARAEPENNLEMIIESFRSFTQNDLVIVSNWKYTSYGKKLIGKYKGMSNFYPIGPIYNDNGLLQKYRLSCSLYVHGHSAGGTNPSLIEAMASGKALIVFDNVFNRLTTKNLAIYFKNSDELSVLLNNWGSTGLIDSGSKMKELALQKFSWKNEAEKLKSIIGISQESKRNI